MDAGSVAGIVVGSLVGAMCLCGVAGVCCVWYSATEIAERVRKTGKRKNDKNVPQNRKQ